MEEKERYEYFFGTNTIKDNKTNQFYGCVVNLLNQQDKRIKELEEENQQLKPQLHDLPKKIVETIKNQMGSIEDVLINCGNGKEDALCWFNEILDTILKKYEGR